MRKSDIFVISSNKVEGPDLYLLQSAMFSELITESENLISRTIETVRMENVSNIECLLPYVDMEEDGCFSFKSSIMDYVFKDLYVSLLENMHSLSFEDFCSPYIKEMLQISSSDTPIIVCWCEDGGFLFIGVLEDFLRMPGSKDGEYKLHAVLSRHS